MKFNFTTHKLNIYITSHSLLNYTYLTAYLVTFLQKLSFLFRNRIRSSFIYDLNYFFSYFLFSLSISNSLTTHWAFHRKFFIV